MNNTLEYKGYLASINYAMDSTYAYGKIEFIRDLIMFDAEDAKDIEKAFHASVDDYLKMCKEDLMEPERPEDGKLNMLLPHRLFKQAINSDSNQFSYYMNKILERDEGKEDIYEGLCEREH